MRRTLTALFSGAVAGLLVGAIPLWRQHVRLAAASTEMPARVAAAQVDSVESGETVLARLLDAASGGDEEARLRAAECAGALSAAQCRAGAPVAASSGAQAALRSILGRWMSLEPVAAIAWMERNSCNGSELHDALEVWAALSPRDCARWVENAMREGRRHPLAEGIARVAPWRFLLQHDLGYGVRLAALLTHQAGDTRTPVVTRNDLRPFIRTAQDAEMAASAMLSDPAWLSPDSPNPNAVLVSLRECWMETDRESWVRWAEAHPEAAARSAPEDGVVGEPYFHAADKGAGALQTLQNEDPALLRRTSDHIMSHWVNEDITAAGEWLNTLPDGPVKAAAAESYAVAAAAEDPRAALRWAGTLPDADARDRTLRRVFVTWHTSDPAAAGAWLAQSGWTAAQQRAMQDILATLPGPAPDPGD